YSLFLLFSACTFYFVVRLVEPPAPPKTRLYIGLFSSLVLAMYTHFFGGVLVAAALLTLGADAVVRGEPPKPILVCAAAAGVAALGLFPFGMSAAGVHYGVRGEPVGLHDLARALYRVIMHVSVAVSPIALSAGLVGFVALLAGGLWPKRHGG